MKVYTANKDGVMVLDLLIALQIGGEGPMTQSQLRKALRIEVMQVTDSTHVWFEDEHETIYDPIHGPFPVYGPKAQHMESN